MSRAMLSLMLLAAFGFMATLQTPFLFKSHVKIPGLKENAFMDADQFAQAVTAYYKQKPTDLPNNIYIFSVTGEETKKPNQLLELVRDMKSNKQIFADSPNGYVTNYLRYNKTVEVSESLLKNLKTLGAEYQRNVSTLQNFEKVLSQRANTKSVTVDLVSVNLSDIKLLDRFIQKAEKTLANGKYLILVTFDAPKAPTKLAMVEEEQFNSRRILQETNTSNTTNGTTLAISANTFTGISIGLFVTAVTIIAVGLLFDIKTPGSFISTPLHIGKEH